MRNVSSKNHQQKSVTIISRYDDDDDNEEEEVRCIQARILALSIKCTVKIPRSYKVRSNLKYSNFMNISILPSYSNQIDTAS